MNPDSINHSYLQSFQDYVRTYSEDLFIEMFYGFKTADLVKVFEGIKGELVLTQLEIADNLARRWNKSFEPIEVARMKPRVLKTVTNKVDFQIVPQLYESEYLGAFRKKGQSVTDWPFQAFIMAKILAKLMQEFEVAAWKGVESTSPGTGDYLRETFNGYLEIIRLAILAGDVTPVTTGVINSGNIIANFRAMWAAVGDVYKENGTDIQVSYALYDMYRIAYKDAYKIDPAYVTITDAGYKGLEFELGNGNTRIIPVNGMAGSQRVVITPRENLALGIDSPSDVMFRVKEELRTLDFAMDFRMGAQILLQKDGVLVVNDQA